VSNRGRPPGPRGLAIRAGLAFYTPTNPCKRGHLSQRSTNDGHCLECRPIDDRLAYQKNRERVLARHKKKNATEEAKAAKRSYRAANKDRVAASRTEEYYARKRANAALWKEKHRERYREIHRKSALKHYDAAYFEAYYEANKSRIKQRMARYRQATRDIRRANQAKRRAAKLRATPLWADDVKIKTLYRLARELEKRDGIQRHVDHIVPLCGKKVCGLHVHNNLRIIAAIENARKSNKLLDIA